MNTTDVAETVFTSR